MMDIILRQAFSTDEMGGSMASKKSIGKAVKILRSINGISVNDLSVICGLDRKSVTRRENGFEDFFAGEIVDVGSAINMRPENIFNWAEIIESMPEKILKKFEKSILGSP